MASEKEEVKFVLDLDTKEFMSGVSQSLDKIVELGEPKNLAGLISGLSSAAAAVGVLGVAFLAAKSAFELVLDSEKIAATNQQFEVLAKNAGIFAKDLKEGLLQASGGLVDDTDLLNAANSAILKLGGNAEKLPEIMEAARKASLVMGGTVLENFDKISHAVATGSQRMLAQLGLKVDITKAEQDYAQKLGVTVDALSEAGKQHARLDAVLNKSEESYKGINGQVLEATNLWKETTVLIKDLGEMITMVLGTIFKPFVVEMLSGLKEITKDVKTFLTSWFGDESQKAEASLERISDKLLQLKNRKLELESGDISMFDKIFGLSKEEQLSNVNREIALTTAEVSKLNKEVEKTKEKSEEAAKALKESVSGDKGKDPGIDLDKRKAQETNFQAEILRLKQATNKAELDMSSDLMKTEEILNQERILVHQEEKARIDDLNQKVKKGIILRSQAEQMKVEITKQSTLKIEEIDKKSESEKLKTIERRLAAEKNFFKQVKLESERSAKASAIAWQKSGGAGALAMKTFQSSFSNAMVAIGEGSQSASAIMQGAFLNAIADIAQYMGAEMVAEGIGTFNYAKAAAGSGLLILSGVIRGAAKGSSGGGGGGGSYGGGFDSSSGGGSFRGDSQSTSSQLQQNQQQASKTVTVQVHGNYFETEQTRTRLVEMIREATDATDFKYVQIGSK